MVPLRSVISAREGGGGVMSSCGCMAAICAALGSSGCTTVDQASFAASTPYSPRNSSAAITIRPRALSSTRRWSRSGAVTRTCSISGTAPPRAGAPFRREGGGWSGRSVSVN